MKTSLVFCSVFLACNVSCAESIVEDNFNVYANGSVVGQGNWESYLNGENFVVQEDKVVEGAKALYNHIPQSSVIGKKGTLQLDGRQVVYVKIEDRNDWLGGGVQVRMTNGLWNQSQPFTSVAFKEDGYIAYYDQSGVGGYKNFSVCDDNDWMLLEMEWRSSDKSARYRMNNENWTDWKPFTYGSSFTGFDYVGLGFYAYGSGGVYVDVLGPSPIPEPATITLLIAGLIACGLLFLRRR